MNWIRKRLEDSKNKLGSVYQTSAASEIYEIASVRNYPRELKINSNISLFLIARVGDLEREVVYESKRQVDEICGGANNEG
jgi:hypothetical protein